jgi:hypothetical protein
MAVRETRHQIRSVFDESFLQQLANEHEIVFSESTGKVHGLEACLKRLYTFRKERLEHDRKVLFPGGVANVEH